MDRVSKPHRARAPRIHRRDVDQDRHGAVAGMGAARPQASRQSSARPLEDHDVPSCPAPRPDRRAVADRGADRRRRTYVEKVLLPTLHEGDVVIMDNLGSHKGKAVRPLIRSAGAKLFFLPKYSPDLNPIEQVFAKLKHILRKAVARTVEAICTAVGKILGTFAPEECATISKIQAMPNLKSSRFSIQGRLLRSPFLSFR